jgi:hypothetical protein
MNLPSPFQILSQDNINFTISVRYILPDGSLSRPITAIFYPPENDQASTIPVIILEAPDKKRSAVLLVPKGPGHCSSIIFPAA